MGTPESLVARPTSTSSEPSVDKESKYRLDDVSTVPEAWNEYEKGINGKPSIKALIESKAKWRRD